MLRNVCQNTIVKTAFKSVKTFLRLTCTNAQTADEKIKNIVLDSIIMVNAPINSFFDNVSLLKRRYQNIDQPNISYIWLINVLIIYDVL